MRTPESGGAVGITWMGAAGLQVRAMYSRGCRAGRAEGERGSHRKISPVSESGSPSQNRRSLCGGSDGLSSYVSGSCGSGAAGGGGGGDDDDTDGGDGR